MSAPTRPYLFYDTAVSLCSTCYRRIDAKIVFESGCTTHRPFEQVEDMVDMVVRNEMEPDIVEISGGGPTLHPQFFLASLLGLLTAVLRAFPK